MHKLLLGVVMLVVMLLAACAPQTIDSPSPVNTPDTPVTEKEDTPDEKTEDEEDTPFSFYGEGCNPYFFDCIGWWGTCEWDYWNKVYLCEDVMFYDPPGYECGFDLWLGYVYRPTYEIKNPWNP